MSIPYTNYVNITSNLAGSTPIPSAILTTRVFSANPVFPSGDITVTFNNLQAVQAYLQGTTSEEYQRAAFYFQTNQKNFNVPENIQFCFWNQDAATAPNIQGANLLSLGTTLGTLQAITTGDFYLTLEGATYHVTSLDFAGLSFTQIASALQTAIQLNSGGGTLWTTATVTYDATTNNFIFAGGVAGTCTISTAIGATQDALTPIGWLVANTPIAYPGGPLLNAGTVAENITTFLTNTTANNNNYGSFVFTNAIATDLSTAEITAIATWVGNPVPSPNVSYMGLTQVNSGNYAAISAALVSLGGMGLTLSPISTEFPEMIPGMILASIDYSTGTNTVMNYMYQNYSNVTPSVTTGAAYTTYTNAGVNFVGQTQINGVQPAFYQTGVLTGASNISAITSMTAYGDEIWLKNAAAAELLNLQLTQTQIPANPQGVAMILTSLQTVVNQALNNGSISVGNALTNNQINSIAGWSGDPDAWRQVQNSGYWMGCSIVSTGSPPTYTAQYTLIYKKDDVINQINGTHVLI